MLERPWTTPCGRRWRSSHGCFWGAEKGFWMLPASIDVGWVAGGYTRMRAMRGVFGTNGSYEVWDCLRSGRTSYDALLKQFWEGHDPTQGEARRGVGTQYARDLLLQRRAAGGARSRGRVSKRFDGPTGSERSRRKSRLLRSILRRDYTTVPRQNGAGLRHGGTGAAVRLSALVRAAIGKAPLPSPYGSGRLAPGFISPAAVVNPRHRADQHDVPARERPPRLASQSS